MFNTPPRGPRWGVGGSIGVAHLRHFLFKIFKAPEELKDPARFIHGVIVAKCTGGGVNAAFSPFRVAAGHALVVFFELGADVGVWDVSFRFDVNEAVDPCTDKALLQSIRVHGKGMTGGGELLDGVTEGHGSG